MRSVLVVDDERGIRSLVSRWAESHGYSATAAASAEDALEEMNDRPSAVAICDIRMPNHDGFWLAEQLHQHFPDTAVIMATGVLELDAAVLSARTSAIDYLSKPFTSMQLTAAVEHGIEWHHERVSVRAWQQRLQTDLDRRHGKLKEALAEHGVASLGQLDAMLSMLAACSPRVYEHSRRVARLAMSLARATGVTEPELLDVERAGLLHDIGKLAVPEAILNKPATLTGGEWQIMRQRVDVASDLLMDAAFLEKALEMIQSSQQWCNGRAHATGLQNSDIPLGGRVLAVADAFDSMTHAQPYREAMIAADALQELSRGCGTQFDQAVVDALSALTRS
jgi:putative two-component system response regulator